MFFKVRITFGTWRCCVEIECLLLLDDCRYAAQPENCRIDKSNFLVSGLGDSYEADSEEFQLKPLDKDQCQQFRNKAVHQSGQQATLEPHPTKMTLNKQTNFSDSNITILQSSYVNASRSEEHTSELQSPVPISYAVFCLKKKKNKQTSNTLTP